MEDAAEETRELPPSRCRPTPLGFRDNRRSGHPLPAIGDEAGLKDPSGDQEVDDRARGSSALQCGLRLLRRHVVALVDDDRRPKPETSAALSESDVLLGSPVGIVEAQTQATAGLSVPRHESVPKLHRHHAARISADKGADRPPTRICRSWSPAGASRRMFVSEHRVYAERVHKYAPPPWRMFDALVDSEIDGYGSGTVRSIRVSSKPKGRPSSSGGSLWPVSPDDTIEFHLLSEGTRHGHALHLVLSFAAGRARRRARSAETQSRFRGGLAGVGRHRSAPRVGRKGRADRSRVTGGVRPDVGAKSPGGSGDTRHPQGRRRGGAGDRTITASAH